MKPCWPDRRRFIEIFRLAEARHRNTGHDIADEFFTRHEPDVISLRIHPGRMGFALGIIIRDKLLALADKGHSAVERR
jgi:hypothetical protein